MLQTVWKVITARLLNVSSPTFTTMTQGTLLSSSMNFGSSSSTGKKTGKCGLNEGRWHLPEVKLGASYIWHALYSLPYYNILGEVACRTTSKITGIGPGERAWGDVKHLKTGKRAALSGAKTEKQSILFTTARINAARLRRSEMEKIDAKGQGSMWGDDDNVK